jgi:hypothetical protein
VSTALNLDFDILLILCVCEAHLSFVARSSHKIYPRR